MPSVRRIRLLTLAIIVTVVFVIFYTSGVDSGEGSFYDKTMKAMHYPQGQSIINSRTGAKTGHIPADTDGDGDIDDDDKKAKQQLKDSLNAAAQKAMDKTNKKAPVQPDSPNKVVGVGSSREGQEKKPASGGEVAGTGSDASKPKPVEEVKVPEDGNDAKVQLANILKKSPVVIFSKSYCRFSKRAKGILLEKYTIEPKPFVVELDEHPLGAELQDELLEATGRRTVPNILINGVSLGGSDQIVDLDEHDQLTSKIQEMGKRKVQISKLLVAEEVKGATPHA